jgi:patatin-like phospholipase/acyl hydrolase
MKIIEKTLKYFAIAMLPLALVMYVQYSTGWLPNYFGFGNWLTLSLSVLMGSWFAALQTCKQEDARQLELFRQLEVGWARQNLLEEHAAVDEEFKTILKHKADVDKQFKALQDILESGQHSNEILEQIKELTKQKEDFDKFLAVARRQKAEIDEQIKKNV